MAILRDWSAFAELEPESEAEAPRRGRLGADLLDVRAILPERNELNILGMNEMLDCRTGDLVGLEETQEQRRLAEVAASTLTEFAVR